MPKRTRTRKLIRQRGGYEVDVLRESDFKYTRSPQRKEWTKRAFPYGAYLLNAIYTIPWNTYEFEGDVDLFRIEDLTKEEKEERKFKNRFKLIQETRRVKANNSNGLPYYFFGGCVYELLGALYPSPSYPNLHDYVDPTGDVDVAVMFPTQIEIEGDYPEEFIEYPFNTVQQTEQNEKPTIYNSLFDHYTKWIMEQIKQKLSSPIFRPLHDLTEPFDIREDENGKQADYLIQVGNIWIIREPTIKILVIAMFEGVAEADHIFDFSFRGDLDTIGELPPLIKPREIPRMFLKTQNPQFTNIPVQNFAELIAGNWSGMYDRQRLVNTENSHKLFNHIQRMRYLNTLLPMILNLDNLDREDSSNIAREVIGFCFFLNNIDAETKCKFSYIQPDECTPKTIKEIELSMLDKLLGMVGEKFPERKKFIEKFITIPTKGGRRRKTRKL